MPSLRISRYTVQGAPSALALPLAADLVRLWRLPVDPSRSLDIRQQRRIALLPRTASQRIARTCRMPSVRRRSDLRDPAHRLDAVLDSVPVQESLGDLSRRSGSAWGKNALASFWISLARRRSFNSRSSSLSRVDSALFRPSRVLLSTSSCYSPVSNG